MRLCASLPAGKPAQDMKSCLLISICFSMDGILVLLFLGYSADKEAF
jgi:hypothetical protein